MAKPTTRFVVPYLTLVGKLKEEAQKLDIVYAFLAMKKHYSKLYANDPDAARAASETLAFTDERTEDAPQAHRR